jgi:hypothetical protein
MRDSKGTEPRMKNRPMSQRVSEWPRALDAGVIFLLDCGDHILDFWGSMRTWGISALPVPIGEGQGAGMRRDTRVNGVVARHVGW